MWCAEFLHVKPGKGAAFVRTKLKNYITGNVVDRTFRGGESVEQAELEKKETQFTYQDGDDVSTSCHVTPVKHVLPVHAHSGSFASLLSSSKFTPPRQSVLAS